MSEKFDINNITPEQYLMLNKAIANGEGMTPAFQTDIFDVEKVIREASPEKLEQIMEAVGDFAKKALGLAGEAAEKIQVHGDFEGKAVDIEKVVPMGFTCPCDDAALIGRGLKEPHLFFLPADAKFTTWTNEVIYERKGPRVDRQKIVLAHKGKRIRGIGHRNRKTIDSGYTKS